MRIMRHQTATSERKTDTRPFRVEGMMSAPPGRTCEITFRDAGEKDGPIVPPAMPPSSPRPRAQNNAGG